MKNHFHKEAKRVFNKYAGKEWIILVYESDDYWVEKEEKIKTKTIPIWAKICAE
ncbi:MAG: hypothetical protein HND49_03900 [Planctomycetes bacterium]|nr:hypothetical protein [Planctomycetota bacterium]